MLAIVCVACWLPVNVLQNRDSQPLAVLSKRYENGSEQERRIALLGLIHLADPRAEDLYRKAFSQEKGENRDLAAIGLTNLGKDEDPVCEVMLNWIKSHDNHGGWLTYFHKDMMPGSPTRLWKVVATAINTDRSSKYDMPLYGWYSWTNGPLDEIANQSIVKLPRFSAGLERSLLMDYLMTLISKQPLHNKPFIEPLKKLYAVDSKFTPGIAAAVVLRSNPADADAFAVLSNVFQHSSTFYHSDMTEMVVGHDELRKKLVEICLKRLESEDNRYEQHALMRTLSRLKAEVSEPMLKQLLRLLEQDETHAPAMNYLLKNHPEPWRLIETQFLRRLEMFREKPSYTMSWFVSGLKEVPQKYSEPMKSAFFAELNVECAAYAVHCLALFEDEKMSKFIRHRLANEARSEKDSEGVLDKEYQVRICVLQVLCQRPRVARQFQIELIQLLSNPDERTVESAASCFRSIHMEK